MQWARLIAKHAADTESRFHRNIIIDLSMLISERDVSGEVVRFSNLRTAEWIELIFTG